VFRVFESPPRHCQLRMSKVEGRVSPTEESTAAAVIEVDLTGERADSGVMAMLVFAVGAMSGLAAAAMQAAAGSGAVVV